jgi:hypothetical protein
MIPLFRADGSRRNDFPNFPILPVGRANFIQIELKFCDPPSEVDLQETNRFVKICPLAQPFTDPVVAVSDRLTVNAR